MIKLSVIVPVYNVETYLAKCIESVLSQNYPGELEIILVDDGSTDKSLSICNYYSLKDKKIKTIHKENGGVSSARNVGIIASSGDYIAFLDPDDFWVENSIYDLLQTAENTRADIILGRAVRYLDKEGCFSPYPDNICINHDQGSTRHILFDILDPQNRFEWHVCKAIYKAKFIKSNGLFFKNGVLHEEIEWMPRVFSLANSIETVNNIFVCFRIKKGELISDDISGNIKNHQDILKVIYSLSTYFKYLSLDREIKELFYINFSEIYAEVFIRQALIKDKKSKILLEKLSHYLDFYSGKYSKYIKNMIKNFGYEKTCKIIRTFGNVVIVYNKAKKRVNYTMKKIRGD